MGAACARYTSPSGRSTTDVFAETCPARFRSEPSSTARALSSNTSAWLGNEAPRGVIGTTLASSAAVVTRGSGSGASEVRDGGGGSSLHPAPAHMHAIRSPPSNRRLHAPSPIDVVCLMEVVLCRKPKDVSRDRLRPLEKRPRLFGNEPLHGALAATPGRQGICHLCRACELVAGTWRERAIQQAFEIGGDVRPQPPDAHVAALADGSEDGFGVCAIKRSLQCQQLVQQDRRRPEVHARLQPPCERVR